MISNCFFESNQDDNTSFYIYSNLENVSLFIDGDNISAIPDAQGVAQFLMDIHRRKHFNECNIKISNELHFSLSSRLELVLGFLTITFYYSDDAFCPHLAWFGDPNPIFDELNKQFLRYHKLKAFW